VAASLLEAAGRTVVAIDDDYYRAGTAGLPTAASCSAMPRTAASRAER
jgi:hypothetical protein